MPKSLNMEHIYFFFLIQIFIKIFLWIFTEFGIVFVFSFDRVPFLPVLMTLSDSSPHCDLHPESSKTYRNCPDDLTSLFCPLYPD